MLDQSIVVRSQLAFIFLLVASASLASANAICKCGNGDADPPSKKVVDYNVQISESGEQFNETIEVDTEKQTELFKVPAHNDVDHSNILHDFKMNMSMLLLPEKKFCYLLPLQDELLAPRKLINGLDTAERTVSKTSETKSFGSKWIVDKEMTDRSVLSDELATFCAKYPIYYVKRMKESLVSTRIQTGETKIRKRRQLPRWVTPNMMVQFKKATTNYLKIYKDELCTGGKGKLDEFDLANCKYGAMPKIRSWKVRCKITSHTCYYIAWCDTYLDYKNCHFRNNVYCCEYICSE